jgi:hypothetical protein
MCSAPVRARRLRTELGAPVAVSRFLRVECGEGLADKTEKPAFAEEVARMASM